MRVYGFVTSVGYQFFNTDTLEHSNQLDKRDFHDEHDIHFIRGTEPKRKNIGDIALIDGSSSPVFSEKAKSVFPDAGRYIKLTNLEDFELFDAPVLDVLDYEKSEFDYFDDEKTEIMSIDKYAFKEELLLNIEAFRLKDFWSYPTFLTEKFVEKYKANNLTGIEFHCVYDSENPENVGKFIQEM